MKKKQLERHVDNKIVGASIISFLLGLTVTLVVFSMYQSFQETTETAIKRLKQDNRDSISRINELENEQDYLRHKEEYKKICNEYAITRNGHYENKVLYSSLHKTTVCRIFFLNDDSKEFTIR